MLIVWPRIPTVSSPLQSKIQSLNFQTRSPWCSEDQSPNRGKPRHMVWRALLKCFKNLKVFRRLWFFMSSCQRLEVTFCICVFLHVVIPGLHIVALVYPLGRNSIIPLFFRVIENLAKRPHSNYTHRTHTATLDKYLQVFNCIKSKYFIAHTLYKQQICHWLKQKSICF